MGKQQLQLRLAQLGEGREVCAWIGARHYLKSTPPGYVAALEFLASGRRVGAMLLGRPTARTLDPREWLELTRVFFLEEAPKNTESHALGMMRRWVRVWLPNVRGLLSYSDPERHAGTIYRADGWANFGHTGTHSAAGWRSRPNRVALPPTRKLRWVRTP